MLLRRYHDKKAKVKTDEDTVEALKELAEAGKKEWNDFTVVELKDIAKAEGIEGYSSMNKDELIEAILEL